MADILEFNTSTGAQRGIFSDDLRPLWFAAYTFPRHEKRVAQQLEERAIEAYLPLYDSARQWNKRRVHIELPLFPGYIFVRIPFRERVRVLETPSVAYLVSSKGRPIPVPEEQVAQVRECLSRKLKFEPCEYLHPGSRVRVQSGPLCGLEGVVLRRNGRLRFVISVDLIMRSIAVTVEARDLQLVTESPIVAA